MRTIARLHKLGIDAFREKTFYLLHLLRKPPEDVGVDHRHACKGCLRDDEKTIVCTGCPARTFGWFALFTMRNSGVFPPRIERIHGWKRKISFRRAAPRETARAEAGGARRDRTDDLLLAKQALSQLSYGPGSREASTRERKLVGLGRFELPTSRLSSARSNQLSYKP